MSVLGLTVSVSLQVFPKKEIYFLGYGLKAKRQISICLTTFELIGESRECHSPLLRCRPHSLSLSSVRLIFMLTVLGRFSTNSI